MVEVYLHEDSRGRLSSFVATGHAGWAEDGRDIVCAAVSTLLQSAWLGLTEVAGIEVSGERSKGAAASRFELSWPEAARDDVAVRAIVQTAARSVERIGSQYPAHVRVIVERGDG